MSEAALMPAAELPGAPLGAQLAAARETCGLSVADIAQQLKLSPSQVEALESGNYSRLPGAVFVRGFVRNYARLVKLDVAALLAQAAHELPPSAPVIQAAQLAAEIPFPTARGFGWKKYAIAALVVSIPLVIFEFYYDDAQQSAVNSRQVELPAPQVIAAISTPVEQPVAPPVQTQEVAVPPVLTPQQPAVRAVEIAPAAKIAAGRGEQLVRLRFSRESWVEIRDRSGRKIFSQLNHAGTEQVVSGLPPLSVIVGNANGVQLIHNEQPVDLGPHTKVDVARLTLE